MSWNTVAKSWNLGPGSKSRQKRVRGWNWFDCQVLVPSSTFWFCISVLFCFCLFRLLKLLLHNIIRELWHSDAVQGPQGEKCSPSYLLLLARGQGPPHHARVYPTLVLLLSLNVQCSCSGWPTGNGKKLSNSQACCLAQLCLGAVKFLSISCGPSYVRRLYGQWSMEPHVSCSFWVFSSRCYPRNAIGS